MSTKLFVGNISFQTTENDLQDTFAAHGTVVETNLMMDRATGRAREVRITYELLYSVTDKNGDFLIATSQLSQRRELTYTDDQILGKEAEENQLYTEMQRDIARQITGRLSALQLGQKGQTGK